MLLLLLNQQSDPYVFSETFTGANGAAWGNGWSVDTTYSTIQNNKASITTGSPFAYSFQGGTRALSAFPLEFTVTVTPGAGYASTEQYTFFETYQGQGASPTDSGLDAYQFQIKYQGGARLELQKRQAGVSTFLVGGSTALTTATSFMVRARIEGATYFGKIWDASTSEPASWDWTYYGEPGVLLTPTKRFGLYHMNGADNVSRTVTFDDLSITLTELGTVTAGAGLTAAASSVVSTTGHVDAGAQLTAAAVTQLTSTGHVDAGAQLTATALTQLSTTGHVDASGALSAAASSVVSTTGHVDAGAQLTAAALTQLTSTGHIDANGALSAAASSVVSTTGHVDAGAQLTAAALTQLTSTGHIDANGALSAAASSVVSTTGHVDAGAQLTAAALTQLTSTGHVDASAQLTAAALTQLTATGHVDAAGSLSAAVTTERPTTGHVDASAALTAAALTQLTTAGHVDAAGQLVAQASTVVATTGQVGATARASATDSDDSGSVAASATLSAGASSVVSTTGHVDSATALSADAESYEVHETTGSAGVAAEVTGWAPYHSGWLDHDAIRTSLWDPEEGTSGWTADGGAGGVVTLGESDNGPTLQITGAGGDVTSAHLTTEASAPTDAWYLPSAIVAASAANGHPVTVLSSISASGSNAAFEPGTSGTSTHWPDTIQGSRLDGAWGYVPSGGGLGAVFAVSPASVPDRGPLTETVGFAQIWLNRIPAEGWVPSKSVWLQQKYRLYLGRSVSHLYLRSITGRPNPTVTKEFTGLTPGRSYAVAVRIRGDGAATSLRVDVPGVADGTMLLELTPRIHPIEDLPSTFGDTADGVLHFVATEVSHRVVLAGEAGDGDVLVEQVDFVLSSEVDASTPLVVDVASAAVGEHTDPTTGEVNATAELSTGSSWGGTSGTPVTLPFTADFSSSVPSELWVDPSSGTPIDVVDGRLRATADHWGYGNIFVPALPAVTSLELSFDLDVVRDPADTGSYADIYVNLLRSGDSFGYNFPQTYFSVEDHDPDSYRYAGIGSFRVIAEDSALTPNSWVDGGSTPGFVSGGTHRFRFQLKNDAISLKYWSLADPEPDWLLVVADTATPGAAIENLNLGFDTQARAEFYFSNFSITDPSAAVGGNFPVWMGSSYVGKPAKVWAGVGHMVKPAKVWNGTSWVLLPY